MSKTFQDLSNAICNLPDSEVREELLNLHGNLSEEASEEIAMEKFDAIVADLGRDAEDFYLAWVRA
jgi:stress response protein SCP2